MRGSAVATIDWSSAASRTVSRIALNASRLRRRSIGGAPVGSSGTVVVAFTRSLGSWSIVITRTRRHTPSIAVGHAKRREAPESQGFSMYHDRGAEPRADIGKSMAALAGLYAPPFFTRRRSRPGPGLRRGSTQQGDPPRGSPFPALPASRGPVTWASRQISRSWCG
jgi:hypothetical protein